jgi:hypothetical protein
MLQDGVWTMKDEDQSIVLAVADLAIDGKSVRKIAAELGIPQTTVFRLKKQAHDRGLC